MRIEAYNQVQQVYNANNAKKTQKTQVSKTSDQVQISSFGKDIQAAKQALAGTPDIREDRTEPLKKAVQNGTYEVSNESFADKLLEKYNEMR